MTVQRAFEVGGCVRDALLGVKTKDIDFAVEADSMEAMSTWLSEQGFEIFLETPEFFTIRARFPKDHAMGRMTADFVLCRKDGPSSNARHPDSVAVGTIEDDLARRDFTVNALAKLVFDDGHWLPEAGCILDPWDGLTDLKSMTLRFVGDPNERLAEDALRALRGVRFTVTKGFRMAPETKSAIMSMQRATLAAVSTERIREELHRAFHHNTRRTIMVLLDLGLFDAVFKDGLWLEPTMKS